MKKKAKKESCHGEMKKHVKEDMKMEKKLMHEDKELMHKMKSKKKK